MKNNVANNKKPGLHRYMRFLQVMRKNNTILMVLLTYMFFTVLYMGPSVWDCNNTTYGFGDNTAGPIWRMQLTPAQPLMGGFENATNYPVGESLYSPVNFSLIGQTTLIYISSKLLGPVCGYNAVNMLGFFASAMVMFGFIYAVTKHRYIAWLAGYAVSFSPYYQMKVGGHVGYGYQALLIGVAWALFRLFKYQRKKDALILGVLTAISFTFDPYFSLLTACVVLPLLVAYAIFTFIDKSKITAKKILGRLKLLLLSFSTFLIFLMPVIMPVLLNRETINASVSALRGNILFEARACSNLPHEYFLPFVLHPVFQRIFGKDEYIKTIDSLHGNFSCGIGEDSVGVSIVVMTIVLSGFIIIGWEKLNKRNFNLVLKYDTRLIFVGFTLLLFVSVVMALPPIKLLGFLPDPTYVLLKITTTWRTLTRFYVLVNFAFVTLFSLFLFYASTKIKLPKRILAVTFIVITCGIFIEYQAFKPFIGNKLSTFSYKTDVPEVYSWLSEQVNINNIAEYPLEKAGGESNASAYYLSMQVVHKKRLFNANDPLIEEEKLRASLKDVSDKQTIDVLRAIGIDAVVIHGVSENEIRKINGLEVVYSAPQSDFNMLAFTPLVKNDSVVVARILPQEEGASTEPVSMLKFHKGFVRNTNIIKSSVDWNYEAINNSILQVVPPPGEGETLNKSVISCFEISFASNELINAVAYFDTGTGKSQSVNLTNEFKKINIESGGYIKLSNDKGYNFRLRNLGC